jgi:hypothetical protein
MSLSFQDLQEALFLDDRDEFIIWQNSSQRNKRVKRGNLFASRGVTVRGKFIDGESGNDVGLSAATALTNAATALATAEGAQTSANGKAKVYYQSAEPTGGTYNAGDIWYDTDDNYKVYVRTGGAWVASFGPMLKLDGNNNVVGLQKVGGIDKAFVLVADYFQVWNGTSADVPFEIVPDPANPPNQVVRIKNAQIQTVDAGKLTAGFIGAQVIAVNGTSATGTAGAGGYIESTTFVPTWVSGAYTVRAYTTSGTYGAFLGKNVPSDVVQVKTIQSDGSYKLFRSLQNQGASATNAPPASGNNAYWQEIDPIPTFNVTIGNETKTIQNLGFRIVSNGYSEFGGALFRGAVIANEGFFGNTVNAVRLDSKGLTVGNNGYLKSRGVGYNGTNFFSTGGTSGGFFLGNTQAEGQSELYQLFVGNPTGNSLWWNGSNLIINGRIGLPQGGDENTDAGLEITSGFGIRRTSKDKVLTITGGNGNGITFGAQIDLIGTEYIGASGNAEGQLILSAGYDSTLSPIDPSRDGCIIFRTSRESGNENIGVVRARIDLDGTFRIIDAGNAFSGAPDTGAGKLVVDTSVEAPIYTSTSSKRFKKKIRNLKNGLDTVSKLRPVTFDWKNKDLKNDIGLIAEEVNDLIPSIIGLNNKGEIVGIDYGKLTPILIQAIKELAIEVCKLKDKIK